MTRPVVIAHRGASGERPEHTMSAYRLAIAQGADSIEPDLVMSKDGVLICRHENEISGTTDVASRAAFTARKTAKTVDGRKVEGWFAEGFTLAELKTLRARERLPELRPQSASHDGEDGIVTFAELLELALSSGISLHPEIKHASYLRALGLDPMAALSEIVRAAGGQRIAYRLFLECFEVWPLREAAAASLKWNCVQLIAARHGPLDQPGATYADMLTDEGLARVAEYAGAISVEKPLILPRDADNRSLPPTDLCKRAHAVGLKVLAWTFRAENKFLPAELQRGDASALNFPRQHGNVDSELRTAYAAGVDGVFCDFPGMAVAARA